MCICPSEQKQTECEKMSSYKFYWRCLESVQNCRNSSTTLHYNATSFGRFLELETTESMEDNNNDRKKTKKEREIDKRKKEKEIDKRKKEKRKLVKNSKFRELAQNFFLAYMVLHS